MATKRPAKIASAKKGKRDQRLCPECQTEMQMTKVLRSSGPSGMFWLCQNTSCAHLRTTSGASAGALEF